MRISDWSTDVCSSDLVIRSLKKVRSPPNDFSGRFDLTRRWSMPRARLKSHSALLPKCVASQTGSFAARSAPEKMPSPSIRSEEHTSELQSLMRISYAVFCLKKKKTPQLHQNDSTKNIDTLQHTKYTE